MKYLTLVLTLTLAACGGGEYQHVEQSHVDTCDQSGGEITFNDDGMACDYGETLPQCPVDNCPIVDEDLAAEMYLCKDQGGDYVYGQCLFEQDRNRCKTNNGAGQDCPKY